MKLISFHEEKNWPTLFGVTAVILVSIAGLIAVIANKLIIESQAGRAMLVLARVLENLIPPVIWVGMVLVVVLWLAVMVWIERMAKQHQVVR